MKRKILSSVLLISMIADGFFIFHPYVRPISIATIILFFLIIFEGPTKEIKKVFANLFTGIGFIITFFLLTIFFYYPDLGSKFQSHFIAYFFVFAILYPTALQIRRFNNKPSLKMDLIYQTRSVAIFYALLIIGEFIANNFFNYNIYTIFSDIRTTDGLAKDTFLGTAFFRSYGLSNEPTVAAFSLISLVLISPNRITLIPFVLITLAMLCTLSTLGLVLLFFLCFKLRTEISAFFIFLFILLLIGLVLGAVDTSQTQMLYKLENITGTARWQTYATYISLLKDSPQLSIIGFGLGGAEDGGRRVIGLLAYVLYEGGIFFLAFFLFFLFNCGFRLSLRSRYLASWATLIFWVTAAQIFLPIAWLAIASQARGKPS